MTADAERMCYVARNRNEPFYRFISVDEPELGADHAKELANEIAKLMRKGMIVERVPIEVGRANFGPPIEGVAP